MYIMYSTRNKLVTTHPPKAQNPVSLQGFDAVLPQLLHGMLFWMDGFLGDFSFFSKIGGLEDLKRKLKGARAFFLQNLEGFKG